MVRQFTAMIGTAHLCQATGDLNAARGHYLAARDLLRQSLGEAAGGLGEAEVARLWADGLELTADAAVALALGVPR